MQRSRLPTAVIKIKKIRQPSVAMWMMVCGKKRAIKMVSLRLENRMERIPETVGGGGGGGDKAQSPWRGLKRQTDRVTSTEAVTKDSGPGREAVGSTDCLRKSPLQGKRRQSTGEIHVKGHAVFQGDYTSAPALDE